MDFSVIICTYNRAANLDGCLRRLASQEDCASIAWEVVVIDNNSSDETKSEVRRLAEELPIEIRYAFEPQQGLNHARNLGVERSRGRYLCYVDDDILVSPRWLAAMFRSLEDNAADAVGGRIHLDDSINLPSWVQPEMYGFLGSQDYGEEPLILDGIDRYPFGGNMAFRRTVFDRIGGFDPKLGRKGGGARRSELFKGAETNFFHRLAKAGARIWYVPDAIVYHQILPVQLTQRYFRTIHFNAGYQKAYHDSKVYGRRLFGAPLFLYPQLVRAVGRYALQVVFKGPSFAFRQQMTVGHFLGLIAGHMRSSSQHSAM